MSTANAKAAMKKHLNAAIGQLGKTTIEIVEREELVVDKDGKPVMEKVKGEDGETTERQKTRTVKDKIKEFKWSQPAKVFVTLSPVDGKPKLVISTVEGRLAKFSLDGGISRAITTMTKQRTDELDKNKVDIGRWQKEIEELTPKMGLPFKEEQDLAVKSTRLNEVNSQLTTRQAAEFYDGPEFFVVRDGSNPPIRVLGRGLNIPHLNWDHGGVKRPAFFAFENEDGSTSVAEVVSGEVDTEYIISIDDDHIIADITEEYPDKASYTKARDAWMQKNGVAEIPDVLDIHLRDRQETVVKLDEDGKEYTVLEGRGEGTAKDPADLKKDIKELLGPQARRMIEIMSIEEASKFLNEDVVQTRTFGFAVPRLNKLVLIQGNIEKGDTWSRLMHEIGGHYVLENLFTEKQWADIGERFLSAEKLNNRVGEAVRAAKKKIPKNTKPENFNREWAAYYLQNNAHRKHSLYRQIMGLFKKALARMGFSPKVFKMSPDDLVTIATTALRKDQTAAPTTEQAVDRVTFGQGEIGPVTKKDILGYDFKQWFGRSVLRNQQTNQPYVYYHGSPDTFETFDIELAGKGGHTTAGLGFFFSPKRKLAEGHAKGGKVIEGFLRLENPYRMSLKESWSFETLNAAKARRLQLMDAGFDGIIMDFGEGTFPYFVVFEPNQVKSAEFNTGEFSRDNDNIYYGSNAEEADVAEMDVKGTYAQKDFINDAAARGAARVGKRVQFVRDSENPYDENAVKITIDGKDIGFVGRQQAPYLADLIDDGVKFEATISSVFERKGVPVYKIKVKKPNTLNDMQLQNWDNILAIPGKHKSGRSFTRIKKKAAVVDDSMLGDIEDASKEVTEKSGNNDGIVKGMLKFASGLKHDHLNHFFSALTLQQLADMYGKEFTPVRKFREAAKGISAQANEMLQEADRLHRRWSRLDSKVAEGMAEVMLKATVLQYDPDVDPRADGSRPPNSDITTLQYKLKEARDALAKTQQSSFTPQQKAKIGSGQIRKIKRLQAELKNARELGPKFEKLPKEAKQIYREVRDLYTKRFEQLRDALEDQINATTTGKTKKQVLANLRFEFDKQLGQGPYFPLSRFGEHIVIVKKSNSEGVEIDRLVRTFERFNNASDFAEGMRSKGFDVTVKKAKEYSQGDRAPHKFATDIVNIVNAAEMDPIARKTVLDEVNQAFIKALPDLSHRKHFMHRKGVKGYSQDALRAFASNMQHSAKHIAKVKHGGDLSLAMEQMNSDDLATSDKAANVVGSLRNELVKRHDAIMNPKVHPAAQLLTSFGFAWNIGPSLASAVVNMTQTPLVAYPIMASKFGWSKSARHLMQASKDYAKGKWTWESGLTVEGASYLTAGEKKMMDVLIKDGTIDISQSHDLAAASSTDYLSLAEKGGNIHRWAVMMKAVSAPFHYAEVANRQVTALATYRLAVGKYGHKRAVEEARGVVESGHFDYGQENRARIMQGNVARVVLLFKQYSQNMTYLLARNAVLAFKKYGVTKEEQRQARLQFAGILGGHFLVSGALGMPIAGIVSAAVSTMAGIFGDDDEPFDFEAEVRNYLADSVGKKGAEILANGPARLLPIDVAGRLSLSDLWWRGDSRNLEGRDLFNHYMMSIAGPTASNFSSLFTGMASMADGEIWKGVEMMLPKAVKDLGKAMRYSEEGVTNRQRDVLMDDLTYMELFGQLVGFTPARVSEMYAGKRAVKGIETALMRRRTRLTNAYIKALESDNAAARQKAVNNVKIWNRKHATQESLLITADSVTRSRKARARYRSKTLDGIYLPDTREYLREYGRFANVDI